MLDGGITNLDPARVRTDFVFFELDRRELRMPFLEALEREGAPADILQCLTRVNIPMSQALMARADLIVATGGQPMVRAAYSSGTPAYGVGAGTVRSHRDLVRMMGEGMAVLAPYIVLAFFAGFVAKMALHL